MNALTRATATTLPRARTALQYRAQSSIAAQPDFKKIWLSDISTYPIIAILGVALVGCSGFMANKIATDKNVRVTKNAKGKVIRTW